MWAAYGALRVSRDRHDVYVSLGESKRQDHAHGISGVAWLLAAVMGFKFARNFKFMPAGLGELWSSQQNDLGQADDCSCDQSCWCL